MPIIKNIAPIPRNSHTRPPFRKSVAAVPNSAVFAIHI